MNHQNKLMSTISSLSLSLSLSRKNTLRVFQAPFVVFIAAAFIVGGFFIAYAEGEPAGIVPANPNTVDAGFTPEIGSTLPRGSEAYLGRTTTYIGPVLGADPDTIQWRVTIDGPADLTPDMVDFDEVGFKDDPDPVPSIGAYHYPFVVVDWNTIQATGSCNTAGTHDNGCTTDAFSLDDNDIFTNADKVLFKPSAPNGSYTIKYELVNSVGNVVLGTHQVAVNVVDPVSVVTAPTGTTIQASNSDTTVQSPSPFLPVLDSSLIRGTDAYYGINAVSSGNFSDVHWRISIAKTGASLTNNLVTVTEKGWFDAYGNEVVDSPYDFSADTDNNDVLVGVGNSNWSIADGDNFTNVDLIQFDINAPVGIYTITRELVDNASNAVISNAYALTVEVVNPSASIVTAAPTLVDEGFIPPIDSTITRGSDAYLGRTTTYTGPQIGLGDPETIKWKVTVSGPSALTADMVDLDEVGWKDQTDSSTLAFHYPLAAVGNNLVAIGSCDLVLPSGHEGGDPCTTVDGFSLVAGDIFTNADKIKFNSNAPAGSYTITYELVNTADELLVGTHVVTVEVVNTAITVTADAQSKTYGDADPAPLAYQITIGSLVNGDTLTGSLSRVAGENVGAYAITQGDLGNSNYNITFISANLTINKKPITVTAVTNSKTYDGNTSAAGTPTITDSLVGTDTANFTETYDTKDVGTGKTLTPSGVVDDGNSGNNYSYTFDTDATGEITQASLTITADDQSKVYGDENPELTASYDGFVGGDTSADLDTQVSLSTTANTASAVGTYPITASGAADVNYNILFVSGTLTVTTAPITVTAVDKSKNYGEADPSLTYTNDPLVGSDAFTGSLSRDAGENVGTYAITQGTLALSSNYALTFVGGTLTINLNSFTEVIVLTEAGQWALVSAPTLFSEAPTATDDEGGAVALLVYRNGVFVVPSEGDDELVNPLSAFYVKTTNGGAIGFKHATISSPTQVSRQLSAGWNLVGTNNDGLAVNEFSSIQNTSQTAGMVTLFVPDTYNSRKDTGYTPWGEDANHDLNANPITALPDNNLSEYDGYWVFMDAAKAFVKNL